MAEGGSTDSDTTAGDSSTDESTTEELPRDVVETVERLTHRARWADDERATTLRDRRDDILAEHGFEARIRSERDGDVLVCYPGEWLEDGEVVIDRIDDRSRALERALDPETDADWETIDADNREVVDAVEEHYGAVHAANVAAFADYMSNHHALRIADATADHVAEFLDEYFPRNAFPDDDQRAVVEESLQRAFEFVDGEPPPIDREADGYDV
ncbi:hypothetical protein HLRTI_001871 [Halorhabdus tiamatea SARL4B]|uniref:RnhA operon protein n=1 Tax=Halorhabdus tiamatea SARL4B TaxID=1033806 RepID=F7PQD3_9EURY|nr:hypothetical protein [Halorhabdus tiamatea]ERJ06108.1 hypothetical protein HLRTI_001871 [Halorhabdus tiamatea SARL4B]CCQ33262.1 conserved hypothetical protein [Halorhabdus tiamatea SARL4B]